MAKTRMLKPETPNDRWNRVEISPVGEHAILYRLLASDGALLYVGITTNPIERWRAHARLKPWWRDVVAIYSMEVPTWLIAQRLELEAIKQDAPRYNIHAAVK